jgi:signal transduction histidine kinase
VDHRTTPTDQGRTRSQGLPRAVLQLAVAAVLLGAVQLVVLLDGPLRPRWLSLLVPLTAGTYVVAGVVAWLRRRSSDIGALLVSGGFVWLATGFFNSDVPALIALGAVSATVPVAVIVHLLLSFPSGRLTTRPLRALVGAGYLTSLVLQMPLYLFAAHPHPHDVLQLADRPDLLQAGVWLQRGAGILVVSLTAAVLVRRLRTAAPAQRRLLAPLYAYGVATVLFVPLSALVLAPRLGWSPVTLYVLQLTVLGLVPVAFGWSLLRGGFARTAELEELGAWLGHQEHGHAALQRALGEVLGDPSVDLVFWVPERAHYVDVHGRALGTSVRDGGRAIAEVELAGTRVGAITYDAAVVDDPDVVRRAGRLVAIAVDRERLTAELLANQEELRQSRLRIVEAGDRERHRVERNLHDGAQQQLMSVALQLRLAQVRLDSGEPPAGALDSAAADLEHAMQELRELARGLHPSLLTDVGLGGALESLAERSPIPVQLSATAGALPESTAVGAYYVVAEALTNAARHSHATQLDVRAEVRGRLLVVEVADDGVGGAVPASGSGLEGLGDRVDSLGGRLRIVSPTGVGTTLTAELPCA